MGSIFTSQLNKAIQFSSLNDERATQSFYLITKKILSLRFRHSDREILASLYNAIVDGIKIRLTHLQDDNLSDVLLIKVFTKKDCDLYSSINESEIVNK